MRVVRILVAAANKAGGRDPAVGAAARKLGAKRLSLRRFPYDVVIRESGGEIVVIAFAHHARRPGYWRKRVPRT